VKEIAANKITMKERIISFSKKHKRLFLITVAVIALDSLFGFDIKFTIINMLWVLINIV
jgi:hypothetical protein